MHSFVNILKAIEWYTLNGYSICTVYEFYLDLYSL